MNDSTNPAGLLVGLVDTRADSTVVRHSCQPVDVPPSKLISERPANLPVDTHLGCFRSSQLWTSSSAAIHSSTAPTETATTGKTFRSDHDVKPCGS